MKKSIALLLSLVLCLSFAACSKTSPENSPASSNTSQTSDNPSSPPAPVARVNFVFGGNNSSATTYVIAVAYAEILNTKLENFHMTVEETGGGFEVLNQLIKHELDACTASDLPAYQAKNGIGSFADVPNSDNFYAWLPVYSGPTSPVVRADSNIYTYEDFIGKRIGIDVVGTGGETLCREMFEALGYTDKVTLVNVSKEESLQMLKTGELDVAIIGTAAPVAALVEYGTTNNFRIIDLTEEEGTFLTEKLGYVVPMVLPAETYTGVAAARCLYMFTNAFIVKDADEELVYKMTKTIWENRDRLELAHSSQKDLSPEMVRNLTLIHEYHPGAARYYREMGWID